MNNFNGDRIELIKTYFRNGLNQLEIQGVLASRHNVILSDRQLRRILSSNNLQRRSHYTDVEVVVCFIQNQLRGSGSLHGYRWMYVKCLQEGLVVRKEDVRQILNLLDPRGVELRSRRRLQRRTYFAKGPNFIWHIDGYDKLKPFGICISGAIDGFSRKIMWLRAYKTNSDPKVIGGYFLETVAEQGGCPRIVRTDMGNENASIRDFQIFLRRNGSDHLTSKCFMYGRSTANQRIEAWWGMLRRQCAQYWMDVMHELKDNGLFSGDDIDKSLIQFCFHNLINTELNDVVKVWNAHTIRSGRGGQMPHGKPTVMYSCPELYGHTDQLYSVTTRDIELCLDECTFTSENPCLLEEIYELCKIYMAENNFVLPNNGQDASELYVTLRNLVLHDL